MGMMFNSHLHVPAHEWYKPARVIDMPVREHNVIKIEQVDPQIFCIRKKNARVPKIKENFLFAGFNGERQAGFCREVPVDKRRIVHKQGDREVGHTRRLNPGSDKNKDFIHGLKMTIGRRAVSVPMII
jgi:hypothetical protein